MLRRMLGVDSWLDVASLENVEEDHSFLFLKKNSMKIFFFFLIWKSWIFSRNWKFWLVIFFFFKQPKKYEPNALSPKALFENFIFLFFWKIWKSWIFSWNWKFWFFFFFEKCRSLEFFSRSWKLWLIDFFFLVENLNFSKELKILNFFFFWKIWKSWIFSWNWKFWFFFFFFFWKIWKYWIF